MDAKGIILAGGSATRLHPINTYLSKHLVPIYDKPMIYYPINTMIEAGIKEILIISTPKDLYTYKNLLGDGSQWGVNFIYAEQAQPGGIAQALIIGEDFLAGHNCVIILGDNLFFNTKLPSILKSCNNLSGARIFLYMVNNPQAYGVAELDTNGKLLNITEKPKFTTSPYAITGAYYYDCNASKYAKQLTPSARNELEITDLNKYYLSHDNLSYDILEQGYWLDAGTPENILLAAQYVAQHSHDLSYLLGSPEFAAWQCGLISNTQLEQLIHQFPLHIKDYVKVVISRREQDGSNTVSNPRSYIDKTQNT